MNYRIERGGGTTGGQLEEEAFGSIKVEHSVETGEALGVMEQVHSYMSFNDSIEIIERVSEKDKYDPTKPRTKFSQDLFSAVSMQLLSEQDQAYNRVAKFTPGLKEIKAEGLKFYTAILKSTVGYRKENWRDKTIADYQHGTDAFFELERNGRKIIVTLNATENPKHNEKANLTFYFPGGMVDPQTKEAQKRYDEDVSATANLIAERLKNPSERFDSEFLTFENLD